MSTDRRLETEVVVPATPEQAWEAIATGPGITAWFMHAEVDGRVGGAVIHHHGPDESSTGTVTAFDPPHRFAYDEEVAPLATEFLVEARSGGTCVVRVVMSGFADGDDWDKAIESYSSGWKQALLSLRLYLTHFRGEPVGSINVSDTVTGDKDEVWVEFVHALGLSEAPVAGEQVATSNEGVPAMAGSVEDAEGPMVTLLLEQPGRGIGFIGAGGPGAEVYTIVRAQLFGADAAEVAAREQEAWASWFAGREPSSTDSRR
jgi:uncharacterized protein YndB with AHSA1/START domain